MDIIILSALSGIAIPFGATLTHFYHSHVHAKRGLLHFLNALGGGLILSAVSLVLIPEGIRSLSIIDISISFMVGAVCFSLIDRALSRASNGFGILLVLSYKKIG